METTVNHIVVVPYILMEPLIAAALIALFLRRRHNIAAVISVLAAALICFRALKLAFTGLRFEGGFEWLRLGDFALSLGVKYDDLAALMLVIVGVVGLCVHVFSLGYLSHDHAKARYFGGLSMFMFSMIGIVLADNLFMMFIFWELVGFSSYLLINHWHEKAAPAAAASARSRAATAWASRRRLTAGGAPEASTRTSHCARAPLKNRAKSTSMASRMAFHRLVLGPLNGGGVPREHPLGVT